MKKCNYSYLFITVLLVFLVLFSSCSAETEETVNETESGNIAISDVVGLSLEEAGNKLLQDGFNNISTDRDYENFDLGNVFVVEQNPKAGIKADPKAEIMLTCKIKYCLTLEMKSDYNLLFNKYDVEIYIDDSFIGSVSNGNTYSNEVDVLEGCHNINLYKQGKHDTGASQSIDVTSDMSFKCTVMHDGSVSFKDIVIEKENTLAMIDVTGNNLSEAKEKLKLLGFMAVSAVSETGETIESDSNWIVISQNVVSGTYIKEKRDILLTCRESKNTDKENANDLEAVKQLKLENSTTIDKDLVVLELKQDTENISQYYVTFAEENAKGAVYKTYKFTESIEPKSLGSLFVKDNKIPEWFKIGETVHVTATVYNTEILNCSVTKIVSDPAVSTNTDSTASKSSTDNSAGKTANTNSSSFEIYFLDVGQGDGAVIICDGHAMMIDGGESKKSDFIYSFLKSHNITNLDYIIATHPDSDHVGGLSGALNYATTDRAFCTVESSDKSAFTDFVKYLGKQGVSITVPGAGDKYSLGSAEFTILGPLSKSKGVSGESLVIRITYGDTSFLFTGDAEESEEKDILNSGYNIKSTVLKVAHHGSKNSSSYSFLYYVDPEYAVISVGGSNTYGHPTDEVLSKLHDADAKTYRTDINGTIHCTSDGKKVVFDVEKNKDMDTYSYAGGYVKKAATAAAAAGSAAAVSKTTEDGETITYVLNKNRLKYHYPDCSDVKKIADHNRWDFTGSKEEIPEGYTPCGHCKP